MKMKLTVAVALLGACLCSCSLQDNVFEQDKFDGTKWKAWRGKDDNFRYMMIHDLFENYLRNGQSISEVEILLGTPDSSKTTDSAHMKYTYDCGIPDWSWRYSQVQTEILFWNGAVAAFQHSE